MSSGQGSLWVPILTGVIGLLGVVVGQLISSWREDQRWKREAKREDLRWQRELVKHWSQERMTAYASLLKAGDMYVDALREHVDAVMRGDSVSESDTNLHEYRWAIVECMASIDIMGSPRIRAVAEDLTRATAGARMSVDHGEHGDRVRQIAALKIRSAKDAFLAEVRTELGIESPSEGFTLPTPL